MLFRSGKLVGNPGGVIRAVLSAAVAAVGGQEVQGSSVSASPNYTASYKQHNAALKWFRQKMESEEHPLPHKLPNNGAVAAIVHPPGMGNTFNTDVSHDWSWLEMVAQLDPQSMAFAVSGPDNRSRGLVGCDVDRRPGSGSYDTSLCAWQGPPPDMI